MLGFLYIFFFLNVMVMLSYLKFYLFVWFWMVMLSCFMECLLFMMLVVCWYCVIRVFCFGVLYCILIDSKWFSMLVDLLFVRWWRRVSFLMMIGWIFGCYVFWMSWLFGVVCMNMCWYYCFMVGVGLYMYSVKMFYCRVIFWLKYMVVCFMVVLIL